MSDPPVLRVVSGGDPTDAEVAALTTVVLALQSGAEAQPPATAGRWRDSSRHGQPWGGTGWRTSARRLSLRRSQ